MFEPKYCMEDSIEYFFGLVKTFKRGVHGTSSTSNSIMSAQLIHMRQSHKVNKACRSWDMFIGNCWRYIDIYDFMIIYDYI